MNNRFIKTTTLILFAVLIGGFVACRSGFSFGKKSKETNANTQDTIKPMISSSKVLILTDFQKDSIKNKKDSVPKFDPAIYSTKSGMIIRPEDLKKIENDTLNNDQ